MYDDVNTLDMQSCWIWKGARNKDNYGLTVRTLDKKTYTIFAHRLSWYQTYGKIPDDMVVDHTCHDPSTCVSGLACPHRACYNPYHLKLATRTENAKRSANNGDSRGKCRQGIHDWVDENVKVFPSGRRACIPCSRVQAKRAAENRKANK